MYQDKLSIYLDDLAARKPAPGGGSAAALTAAAGVALIEMVCNFTIGKEKYKSVEERIKEILTLCVRLRKRLLELVDEDVEAYEKVRDAYKLDKDAKEKRNQAIQEALKKALVSPFEICKISHDAIAFCPDVAKGNINLISDVGVAAAFLEAAYQAALFNVQINLNGIEDEEFISNTKKILDPLEKKIAKVKNDVNKIVKTKMAKGE